KSMLYNSWKIFAFVFIHHIIKNSSNFLTFLGTVMKFITYRKMKLNMEKVCVEMIKAKKIRSQISSTGTTTNTINGLHIYGYQSDENYIVEYCPVIHTAYLNDIENNSIKEYDEYIKQK